MVKLLRWTASLLLLSPLMARAATQYFIETLASPEAPYVQAQVRYRVRLYRRSPLDTGDFVTPYMPDVMVLGVAEDDPVNIQRNGVAWQMIERRYLLFPQRSGDITLPAEVFSGRNIFVRGRPFVLHVRPAPNIRLPWLPANRLTLRQKVEKPDALHVGDQVRRIVTVEAGGLTGAQLPALVPAHIEGLEQQRYREEVKDHIDGFGVTGKRVEYHRYIPRQPGHYQLPGIRISWWDTATNTPHVATLPGVDIEAFAASGAPVAASRTPASGKATGKHPGMAGRWQVSAAVMLVAAVLSLLVGLRWIFPALRRWLRQLWLLHRLRRACRRNDAQSARLALRAYAREQWGVPLDPGEIAERVRQPQLSAALWTLDRTLYHSPPPEWKGRPLLHTLPALTRRQHTSSRQRIPPPLNP